MSDYKCDICNYSCGNRKSSFEKHVLSQKHLNRVIELGFKENHTSLSLSNEIQYTSNNNINTNTIAINTPHSPELLTFFTETIQRMERNIQLLSIQNKIITEKNTKLSQKKKHGIKETKKETIEQKTKYLPEEKMKETKEGVKKDSTHDKMKEPNEKIVGANSVGDGRIFRKENEDIESDTQIQTLNKKMIDYFNSKHKDAINISTFYNRQMGVSFTESQMNIERILTTDMTTLVYEWFCVKIETFDKETLPLQSHKKITYVKIDEEWRVDDGEKEESFLETFLLPFYDLLIKTNEEENRPEQEMMMIERMMTKYMCMSKEIKDKILKKMLKHPKIVCNVKI